MIDDDVPPYVSTSFSAAAWHQTLVEFGVDEVGIKQFFLLAQLGEEGQLEANTIVTKLFAKDIHSPSKFVHKCCCNARAKVVAHATERVRHYVPRREDRQPPISAIMFGGGEFRTCNLKCCDGCFFLNCVVVV